MPFVYDLMLADGEPEFTFVQQLVPVGTLVGTGQAVATLTDGAMEWHVPAPRQGSWWSGLWSMGARLRVGMGWRGWCVRASGWMCRGLCR